MLDGGRLLKRAAPSSVLARRGARAASVVAQQVVEHAAAQLALGVKRAIYIKDDGLGRSPVGVLCRYHKTKAAYGAINQQYIKYLFGACAARQQGYYEVK